MKVAGKYRWEEKPEVQFPTLPSRLTSSLYPGMASHFCLLAASSCLPGKVTGEAGVPALPGGEQDTRGHCVPEVG